MPDKRSNPEPPVLTIVGDGRAGGALARAARAAGIDVRVAGRDDPAATRAGAGAVLLCVPDAQLEPVCVELVAAGVAPDYMGHVSGATGLTALRAAAAAGSTIFVMHPLQTIPDPETDLTGAPCAVSGSPEAVSFATALAERLGFTPFELDDAARSAYHAAASIASNFLVTLEESASELLERSGVEDARELLAPLVLRTAVNWSERGADALTGPIARGDEATVAGHLAELRERAPELVPLYEALAERTRQIAAQGATR